MQLRLEKPFSVEFKRHVTLSDVTNAVILMLLHEAATAGKIAGAVKKYLAKKKSVRLFRSLVRSNRVLRKPAILAQKFPRAHLKPALYKYAARTRGEWRAEKLVEEYKRDAEKKSNLWMAVGALYGYVTRRYEKNTHYRLGQIVAVARGVLVGPRRNYAAGRQTGGNAGRGSGSGSGSGDDGDGGGNGEPPRPRLGFFRLVVGGVA
jgi:uncharacterized membrane protein YgcG